VCNKAECVSYSLQAASHLQRETLHMLKKKVVKLL